jgi:hypothetical protein
LEQILNGLLLCSMTVDEIFRRATQDNLTSDTDACIFFEADRGFFGISIIKDDRYACFGNASLSTFVNEILDT